MAKHFNAGNAITVHRSHIVSLSWAITCGYLWVRHVPWLGVLVQSRWLQILICTIILILSLNAKEPVSPMGINKAVTEHLSCTVNNSA